MAEISETSLVTVASFSFPYEAQIARTSLEASGIPAFVADEHTINMDWLYSHAMGGVRLRVPLKFKEEAIQILQADFSDTVDDDGTGLISCPKCGSSNCEAGSKNRVPAFLLFFFFHLPIKFTKYGIYCRDCGEYTKVNQSNWRNNFG